MRAGRGFGVVLDRERRDVQRPHALHRVVVGAVVADLRRPERGLETLPGLAFQREPVVLGRDRHRLRRHVDHRDVDAAVAVAHLVRPQAERAAEDLVAEADAEQRDLAAQHLLGQLGRVRRGGRVARAVRQEHAVRLKSQQVVQGGRRGQHVHLDAALDHLARGVGLDAQVQRGHAETRRAGRRDHVRLGRRHLAGQVRALHLRAVQHRSDHVVDRAQRVAGEHPGPHRAALAQVARQRAGVDLGDADDPLAHQLLVQRALGTPVGRRPRGVAHHVTVDPDLRGLVVLVVPAGVADLRRRLHHDLPVVGRVGQRLLVAGHAGAEHRFAEGSPLRAVGSAAEHPAIFEYQCGLSARVHWAPPLILSCSIHCG
ncbi:putative thioesterase [Amycolatopsis vancoresmycina DSM 44592]|uniref:Putative thioesterase n=1 Tax=Amycolatopsis vancoresmycina DSM 44592 TaxID=1292037 RepID=R1HQL9_9PSEU|nr:putative thioesterase [Amycolatopsis vancoresmycina DSM 44592]